MNHDQQVYERISAHLIQKKDGFGKERELTYAKIATYSIVGEGAISHIHTAIGIDLQIAVWRELLSVFEANGAAGVSSTLHDITKQIEWEQDAHLRNVRLPASTDALANAIEAKQLEFLPKRWQIMREFVDTCGGIITLQKSTPNSSP